MSSFSHRSLPVSFSLANGPTSEATDEIREILKGRVYYETKDQIADNAFANARDALCLCLLFVRYAEIACGLCVASGHDTGRCLGYEIHITYRSITARAVDFYEYDGAVWRELS